MIHVNILELTTIYSINNKTNHIFKFSHRLKYDLFSNRKLTDISKENSEKNLYIILIKAKIVNNVVNSNT